MKNKIVSLNIGQLIVSKEPIVISTVLGSCVSVCLHSPHKKAGGMIHYAMPKYPGSASDEPLRYGNLAIPELIRKLEELTSESATCFVAKVIGGANGIGSIETQKNIGETNIQIAKELLIKHEIKIIGEHVGGSVGRKALFHVATGRLQSAYVGPGFSRPNALKASSE